jgi:hypothetical protein
MMAKRRRGIDKSLSERIAGSVNSQIATFLYEWFEQAAMRNDRLQFIYRRVLDNGELYDVLGTELGIRTTDTDCYISRT